MSFAKKLLGRLRFPKWDVRGWVSDHREGLKRAGRVTLFWGAFVFVVLLIHREVYSFIMHRKHYTNQSPAPRVSVAPDWAKKLGQDSFVDFGADGSGGAWDPSAPDAVPRVGRLFESNPWVKCVESVTKIYPDQINVKFKYRSPHFALRGNEGFAVFDNEGVRLPGVYAQRPPCDLAVDMVGTRGRLPEPGEKWTDPGFVAGCELAELAKREDLLASAGVIAVDVSNVDGRMNPKRSEIVLQTESGALILWGRAPSTRKFGEITVEEKLVNLSFVLKAYPHLDGIKTARVNVKGAPYVQEAESRLSSRHR